MTPGMAAVKQASARGAVAVEFALLLIPLLTLVLGVTEYGRALFKYNTIAKTVRDSARFLTQQNPSDANYPLAKAKCLAAYGNPFCTGAPLVPGLTTDMVKVCNPVSAADCPGGSYAAVATGFGSINLVEVRVVGYTFTSFFPFVTGASSLLFDDIHTTMRQVL
jgi:Flp pilus assembly protein TadG